MGVLVIVAVVLIVAMMIFEEEIRDFFDAVIERFDREGLSPQQEKKLRNQVRELENTVHVATDMLQEVRATDQLIPQLDLDLRHRIDKFTDAHRPQLPHDKKAIEG